MMNRRKAREYAFVLMFEYRFQPDAIEELLEDLFKEQDAGEQEAYIRRTVLGAIENIKEIDQMIGGLAKGWSLDRISTVCMAVMRVAVYEMKFDDSIPTGVSVNEAVSLAKKYDGEEAAPFVNGILGKLKDSME